MSRVPKELFVLHRNPLDIRLFSEEFALAAARVMQHKGGSG
jgi:hypothetical protein